MPTGCERPEHPTEMGGDGSGEEDPVGFTPLKVGKPESLRHNPRFPYKVLIPGTVLKEPDALAEMRPNGG